MKPQHANWTLVGSFRITRRTWPLSCNQLSALIRDANGAAIVSELVFPDSSLPLLVISTTEAEAIL